MKDFCKLLSVVAILGSLSGGAYAQEAPVEAKRPAFLDNFSNLPLEEREAYGNAKLKARQFFSQKRTFESLEQIHEALLIFDEDPGIWNLKGSCHVEFRSFDKAQIAFQKALALEPNNTGVLFNIAEMHFVTKDWKKCIEKMTNLAELLEVENKGTANPNILELQRLAIFKSLLSHIKLGQKDKAIELAESNWDDFDDTPFTYYSKAALAYSDGEGVKARGWLLSAIRVYGGLQKIANWHDTMIEFGYVQSFYGGNDEDVNLSGE